MREQDIVFKVISTLEDEFPNFNVQSHGGGGDVEFPSIIVAWDTERRSDYTGNTPVVGYERDSEGTVTGVVFHRYYRMELDITVKSYDERERDNTLTDIGDLFQIYEEYPDRFHEDTTEWSVGSASPRNNPVMEPDWYQAGRVVSFIFVQEVVDNDVDPIGGVQHNVSNDY